MRAWGLFMSSFLKMKVIMMVRFLFFLLLYCFSLSGVAHSGFHLSHGPYLQEVTTDGMTIVFLTSQKSFAWVEVKPHNSDNIKSVRYYRLKDGLRDAGNVFHSIRVDGLQANTSYDYRIQSKEIIGFEPYKISYGDSIASRWYTFSTANPRKKGASVFITSDIHGDANKLDKLLSMTDYKTCDAFIYAGDMMDYFEDSEAPFTSFIDISVKRFASYVPFEIVRGNHETRGRLARTYSTYFPKTSGKMYGSYLLGDVMIVMLDTGEDKSDNHPVYAGLIDFNAYRREQVEWLKHLIKTKEYKKAKYHIVVSHFPMIMAKEFKHENIWVGWQDAINQFLPVLNNADIDLLVSGHTHSYAYYEKNTDNNNFPVLVQGSMCAARLDVRDGKIHVKVVSTEGITLKDISL